MVTVTGAGKQERKNQYTADCTGVKKQEGFFNRQDAKDAKKVI
jgi:hypothetical protein